VTVAELRAAPLSDVLDIARQRGLAAGLRAGWQDCPPLHSAGPLGGLTIVPAGYADRYGVSPATGPTGWVAPDSVRGLLAAEELELIRLAPDAPPGARLVGWQLLLAAVRLGIATRLLALAIQHLAERDFDGTALTTRQLVRADIADISASVQLMSQGLWAAQTAAQPQLEWLLLRQDQTERTLAGMFGGAGYLTDHPARCLHVVALLRQLWAAPIEQDSR
jgi:hypothetical protein